MTLLEDELMQMNVVTHLNFDLSKRSEESLEML